MEQPDETPLYDRMEREAHRLPCGGELACLDPLHRCDLYTRLAFERMCRKIGDLQHLYTACGSNWNETFYRMLVRTAGDLENRAAYTALAERVTYGMILRERPSLLRVEALLFGASGLLEGCLDDAYTAELREEFAHLSRKYEIRPMDAAAWQTGRIRPANHPRLRLAQLAVFLVQHDFVVEAMLACRTREDVERLFCVEASPYWSSYYHPGQEVDHSGKRLGRQKAQTLGINLVAPFQFFFGRMNGREHLCEEALALWEALPAERNRYILHWKQAPLTVMNALESQALLQLAREYCERGRCRACFVAPFRLQTLKNSR